MYAFIKNLRDSKILSEELLKLKINPIFLFEIYLSSKDENKLHLKKILEIKEKLNIEHSAILIHLKKQENYNLGFINSLSENFDIILGQGGLNKTNRYFLEKTKIDILLDPQSSLEKIKIDFIHHFNGGLNHILFKLAKENNIALGFSLNFIENFEKKIIAKEIGRINQNMIFSRKYKIPFFLNFIIENKNQIKNIEQLKNILNIFDLSIDQKISSISLIEKILIEKKYKKSDEFIAKGIKLVKE